MNCLDGLGYLNWLFILDFIYPLFDFRSLRLYWGNRQEFIQSKSLLDFSTHTFELVCALLLQALSSHLVNLCAYPLGFVFHLLLLELFFFLNLLEIVLITIFRVQRVIKIIFFLFILLVMIELFRLGLKVFLLRLIDLMHVLLLNLVLISLIILALLLFVNDWFISYFICTKISILHFIGLQLRSLTLVLQVLRVLAPDMHLLFGDSILLWGIVWLMSMLWVIVWLYSEPLHLSEVVILDLFPLGIGILIIILTFTYCIIII